jgi:peptidoglycan DL-endopeptidase CwlO
MSRAGMRVQRLMGAVILAVLALVMTSKLATGSASAAPQGPVTRNASEVLANQMAASGYGWTGGQATCLDELWTEESGFSATAANATSNARGIPQNIAGWSASYQDGNASQQISWGLSYIKGRYSTPCAAWTFERSHTPNWY